MERITGLGISVLLTVSLLFEHPLCVNSRENDNSISYLTEESATAGGSNEKVPSPAESKLKMHLSRQFQFLTQQSKPRPVVDALKPIVVTFEMYLIQILDFNQKEQKLTTQIWEQFKWKDEFIAWNPDDFDGIKKIHLDSSLIWRPDIILYNNYGDNKEGQKEYQLVIQYTGDVLWMPPTILHSSCQVDLTNFPFDTQRCTLEFGSWIYSVKALDIVKPEAEGGSFLNMKSFVSNMEWQVFDTSVDRQELKYECCEDPFVLVTFEFILRRNSGYYARVMLLPVLLLSVIAVFIFCVPAQRPDRTSLGLSLFTSFMLLLLLVVDISPPSVDSKLSTYLSACVGIVTSAVVISILLINISTWTGNVPSWIAVIFLENLARCVFPFTNRAANSKRANTRRQEQQNDVTNDTTRALQYTSREDIYRRENRDSPSQQTPRPQHGSEWVMLVDTLDRLLFIVYTIILAICVGLYFPSPPLF